MANNITELKKAIDAINKNISPDEAGKAHENDIIKDSFWAYRDYSIDREGFTLYLAGGDCISLKQSKSADIKNIQYKKNLDDKKKFFENARVSKTIFKDNKIIEVLSVDHDVYTKSPEKYTTADWETLRNIHLNWVDYYIPYLEKEGISDYRKNTNYERRWQTYIAHANSNRSDKSEMEIIDMELEVRMDELEVPFSYEVLKSDGKVLHKSAKPDLIGVRFEGKKAIFYFIEYKCTKSGMSGDTSLPEHLADMSHIYQDKSLLEKLMKTYNKRMLLLGRESVDFSQYEVESKLLFLLSHVNQKDPGMSSASVASKVIFMVKSRKELDYDYASLKDNVDFVVLKDMKDPIIKVSDFFKIDESAETLSACRVEGNNFNEAGKKKIEELKILFE